MDLKTLRRLTNLNSTASPVHFRAIIPNAFSSCIVGAGAITAKEINFTCQTTLHVYTVLGVKWGQVVTTKGQPEPMSRAWYQIAKVLTGRYDEFYRKFVSVSFFPFFFYFFLLT